MCCGRWLLVWLVDVVVVSLLFSLCGCGGEVVVGLL